MEIKFDRLKPGFGYCTFYKNGKYEIYCEVGNRIFARFNTEDTPLTSELMTIWSEVADELGGEFVNSPVDYPMKQLIHNGIIIPKFSSFPFSNFKIKEHGMFTRSEMPVEIEEMVVAWSRKLGTKYMDDSIFKENFFRDFLKVCAEKDSTCVTNYLEQNPEEFDFSSTRNGLDCIKEVKANWSTTQKKENLEQRKAACLENKSHYGRVFINGTKFTLANYRSEPSGIFMGRGKHPKRGSWKSGVKPEDVILNLSPDAPVPEGFDQTVWEPNKKYIAKWLDSFTHKWKYIYFGAESSIQQSADIAKFDKAKELQKNIGKLDKFIGDNLTNLNSKIRKIATCCYLISELGIRVGDEKDLSEEADTIGAVTLRPEHLVFESDYEIWFNFLGKDSIRFQERKKVNSRVYENLREFVAEGNQRIFYGITSTDINKFLSEAMPGLTSKIFRTCIATNGADLYLTKLDEVGKEDPEYIKKYVAKLANLQAAKLLNHRKTPSAKFQERLEKKEEKLRQYLSEGKTEKADKLQLEIDLLKRTGNYNLSTSLRNYLDPRIFVLWAKNVDFDLKGLYSKTLRKKFSWATPNE